MIARTNRYRQAFAIAGPIFVSALSFVCFFIACTQLLIFFDAPYSLYDSRGIGKIWCITLALAHIVLCASLAPSALRTQIISHVFFFWKRDKHWFSGFIVTGAIFFTLHALFLGALWYAGLLTYTTQWHIGSLNWYVHVLTSVIAVIALAWTEESIFRATIFQYIAYWLPHHRNLCIVLSALIFALAHDMHNPLNLIFVQPALGTGLFTLGLLLTTLFATTNRLAISMGAHCGLVLVKVVLRRIPFLVPAAAAQWPWPLAADLRMAPLAHLLFALAAIFAYCFFSRAKRENLAR